MRRLEKEPVIATGIQEGRAPYIYTASYLRTNLRLYMYWPKMFWHAAAQIIRDLELGDGDAVSNSPNGPPNCSPPEDDFDFDEPRPTTMNAENVEATICADTDLYPNTWEEYTEYQEMLARNSKLLGSPHAWLTGRSCVGRTIKPKLPFRGESQTLTTDGKIGVLRPLC